MPNFCFIFATKLNINKCGESYFREAKTKSVVKSKIRASSVRDSTGGSIQKLSKKTFRKVPKKQKSTSTDKSYDLLYELYLRDKKEKQKLNRQERLTKKTFVKNVKISTPVQKLKQVPGLQFTLSPIRLNDSANVSNEDMEALYESLRRQRIKYIEEENSKLETSVTRKAKAWLEHLKSRNSLKSYENILHEAPALKNSLLTHKTLLTNSLPERKLNSALGDNMKERSVKSSSIPATDKSSIFSVPEINVRSPDANRFSNEFSEKESLQRLSLHPGKWRRSLVNWRLSQQTVRPGEKSSKISSLPSVRLLKKKRLTRSSYVKKDKSKGNCEYFNKINEHLYSNVKRLENLKFSAL